MGTLTVGAGGTYSTIQAAVDAASDGDTILVEAGTYNEVVNVYRDVTIVGPNAGKAGSDSTRGAEAVIKGAYMSADGATLDGLKVSYDGTPVAGNPTAILVGSDGVTLTNLAIDGIDQTQSSGIASIYNAGVTGLAISNNLITDFFWGAYLNPTTGFTATGNTFTSNTAVDIAGDDWAPGTQIGGNDFPDSITHIGYSTNQTNFDFDQFLAGAPNSFGGTGRAISVTGRGDGDAGGQNLHGTAYNDSLGDSSAAPSGLDGTLDGEGGDDRLTGNSGNDTLIGATGNDILRGGSGTDRATYADSISASNIAAVADGDPSAGGAQPGWTVTTATEGTDSLTGVEIVDGAEAGKILLVGSGGFATIQAAVDASSDGDTILVAAGTYNETVNVHKDVSILGPNAGVAGTGARGAEAIVNGGFYMSAAGATLDGLTVLNGAMPGGNSAGIFVNADDVTLANLVLQGNGTDQRAGVTTTYNGGVTGLVLSNSLVTGWDWGAYFNPTTQFTATGNSFDGNGNAILGDDWATGTFIDGNSFTDSTGSHIGYGSFDSVEDMRVYFNYPVPQEVGAEDPVELGNFFDAGSRALSIFAYGDGTPGGQTITGTDDSNGFYASESVPGSGTNSTFLGLGGNDIFYGGKSNDTLNGGAGTDTALYDGNRHEYSIGVSTGAGGRIASFTSVSDNEKGNGDEGSDTLIGVEVLVFANKTFDSTMPVQLFDQSNQLLGTFNKIQEAIDLAQDGYTIRLAAGTYDEDLLINVGVTIRGIRTGTTGHAAGRDPANGTGEATIVGNHKVTSESNVTLLGLRFLNDSTTTGGGPSNPTLQFLTGGTGGHSVTNSIFWSAVAGGAANDRAISAPGIATGQLNLTGNLISGASQGLFGTASWGQGLWMDGGGIALNASANVVEWTRTGFSLDGAGGSVYFISNNVLRNLGTAFAMATTKDALLEFNNTFRNVGTEYNFRNLSEDITFDAGQPGNTLQTVGTVNDTIVILAGSGDDTLTGTAGADYIDANNRPDHLNVADTDVLNGLGGNDTLLGRFGTDTLNGGEGEDNLDGGEGDDVVNGEDGNDTLAGGGGNDLLNGGDGVDNVDGGEGDDVVNGEGGNDIMAGGAGDDLLTGGGGADSIDGGSGIDTAVVAGPVTYTPTGTAWTVSTASGGTDTLTNVEIVDSGPGPKVLLVGSGGFATIQAAVNAAGDGDTILIASGTYFEQVTVDGIDNLTIMAADGAQVTIKAPADLVETGRSSGGREIHAVLTAKDSLNLTLQDIDIDGAGRGNTVDESDGPGQANFYGIFYRNSSGSLLDVDITGVRDPYAAGTVAGGGPVVDGVQRGVALVVDNNSLLDFTMIGGSISDFQKNAALFNRADLTVSGITITGGGAQTIIAQNGIQVVNSTGSITANTITGIGYAGPADAYSGAILSSGNTNLVIAGNSIVGANADSPDAKVVGIWVYQTGAPNSGGTIAGNSISHVDYGIDVSGDLAPDSIQIENNSITQIDGSDNEPSGVSFAPNPALLTAHDVEGSSADDFLAGGAGQDILSGLGGNDTLTGNGGDDTLDGDGGTGDVAVYSGPRAGYNVTATTDGNGLVTGFTAVDDIDSGNGDEGTDSLTGVERLQFGDVLLDVTDPVQLFDGGGRLVGTFDTIQGAVNAAASGYTIRLSAGTYAELVTVDEDVTILGPNAGKPGSGPRSAEAVVSGFHMHSAGATLDGLTVLGGGMLAGNPAGIYVDAADVTLTNLILEGDGTTDIGVLTTYNITGLDLSDSLVTLWNAGTYFNPGTQFAATGNSFVDNGNAIAGDDWAAGTLIDDNGFTGSAGAHVGYGSFDSVEDVGVYFGTENVFGPAPRVTGIYLYGDGTPGGQEVSGTDYSDYMAGAEFVANSGDGAIFHGEGGNDYIDAGSGDDTLDGGTGNDVLAGGDGIDTIVLADSTFTISPVADVDPGTAGNQPGWTITTASEGTDTISGIEIIDSGAAGKILLVGQGGYTTIQAAVDAASDGDTIFVASGTYSELVTVNKDVTVSGINSGIPAGDPRNPESIVDGGFHMNAAGATLDGLTILGGGSLAGNPAGIYVDSDDVTLRNLIIQGDGSAGTGIVTPYNGGVSNLVLSNSRIADWTNGTYFNPGTQFIASGNSFHGNGVALTGDDWDDGTLISGNSFIDSSDGHVGYGAMDSVDDVGAYFGAGNSFDSSGGRIGILAYGDGDAGGQEITGTQFGDYMAGVESPPSGDGAIFHGEEGNDYIDAGSGDDTLDGGAGDDTLDGGSGVDTAIVGSGAVFTQTATGWTVTSSEGTDTLVGIEIVRGSTGPATLFVGNGGFTTIQAAINASSDGDTIMVGAGTYDEDLQIHVGVTILGAGAGDAVAGRDSAGGAGETNIVGHAHVTATADVTLDGLRFVNDSSSTGGGPANPTLQFQTGGTEGHLVTNSIFWSTVAGGANGVDDRAISANVIADGLITISDNLISGTAQGQFTTASWGRAIWFDGGGVDLAVTGNIIEWSRTGLNLDMSGDSTVQVSGNSFRGLGTLMAVGVDSNGLTVSDNDIERVGTDFSFRNLSTGVTFNAGAAIGVLTTVGDTNDLVVVLGGSGSDSLTGTEGADYIDGNNSPTDPAAADTDVLSGMGGNDILFGRRGNDMLDGGSGDDSMTGGTGNDVYVVDSAGDSITEGPGEGTDEVRTALATYTLAPALENLTGLGNVDQTLNGSSFDNVIDGGAGADAMAGGAGNDIYIVDNAGDSVIENSGEGTDEIRTGLAAYSLAALANVENLTGTNSAGQILTGNGSANVIAGAGGADTIDGGAGADSMRGGLGNDVYFVEDFGDSVEENSGEGTDEVRTALATYVLGANVENLTATSDVSHDFRGNAANNVVTGGGGSDFLRLQDGGNDTAIGGGGNDGFLFLGAFTNADVIDGGEGKDELTLQGDYSAGVTLGAVTSVEVMVLLPGNDIRFGAPGNQLYSYSITTTDLNVASGVQLSVDANRLRSGENLVFDGSAETDGSFYIFAGKGVDTLTGGAKNDAFLFRGPGNFTGADTVNGGAGFDELALRGDYTGANKVVFGATTISGIEAIVVVSGHDLRYGKFAGDYSFDLTMNEASVQSGQVMIVDAGTLRSGERLVFDGSAETDGGRFTMFGGQGNDTLTGGSGADSIRGGLGADAMKGKAGADTFVYRTTADSANGAADHILDFVSGSDRIDLSRIDANSLAAGNQEFSWIGSNAFSGSGAASAGELRAYQDGASWFVEGDTNGDGTADLLIQVTGGALTQSDFLP